MTLPRSPHPTTPTAPGAPAPSARSASSAPSGPSGGLGRAIPVALVGAAIVIAGSLVLLRVHLQPPTVAKYVDDAPPDGRVVPLARDGHFVLHVTPTAPVTGAVAARGFLVRGNELRPWNPPYSVTRDGTVTLEGSVATLFAGVPGGRWDVAVAVGRPEVLPTAPADVLAARARQASGDASDRAAADHAAWHLVVEPVQLAPAPEESDAGHGMPGP